MAFKEINIREVRENVVSLISDQWGLLSAGDEKSYNTMTVSWGAVGELWGKDVSFVFIRPQRHTLSFVEHSDFYSLSFYAPEYKSALALCGSKSGRDIDKAKETGLTPLFDRDAPYFEQAKLVLICRKMAVQDIDPKGFIDEKIMDTYTLKDFHKMFVGEITNVLIYE